MSVKEYKLISERWNKWLLKEQPDPLSDDDVEDDEDTTTTTTTTDDDDEDNEGEGEGGAAGEGDEGAGSDVVLDPVPVDPPAGEEGAAVDKGPPVSAAGSDDETTVPAAGEGEAETPAPATPPANPGAPGGPKKVELPPVTVKADGSGVEPVDTTKTDAAKADISNVQVTGDSGGSTVTPASVKQKSGARGSFANADDQVIQKIIELQNLLVQKGKLPKGAVDGIFGSQTGRAIRKSYYS